MEDERNKTLKPAANAIRTSLKRGKTRSRTYKHQHTPPKVPALEAQPVQGKATHKAKVVVQKDVPIPVAQYACTVNQKSPSFLSGKEVYSWKGKEKGIFAKLMNEYARETQSWINSQLKDKFQPEEKEERHFQQDRLIRYLTDIAKPL